MKKSFLAIFLFTLLIPSLALASWWNPLSWFNRWTFNKLEVVSSVEIQTELEEKISELQKQIDDLNKQKLNPSIKVQDVEKKITPTPPNQTPAESIPTPTLNSFENDIIPYVDLKVNNEDGPVIIKKNSSVNVSWVSGNVVSCSSSNGNKPLIGHETIYVDNTTISPFTIRCLTLNGTTISDSVVLNIIDDTLDNSDYYDILYGEGIPYSPTELNSIDCAFYNMNCPVLHIKIN